MSQSNRPQVFNCAFLSQGKVHRIVVSGALCLTPLPVQESASMSSDPPPPYPGGPSAPLIEEKNGQPGKKAKLGGLW